MKTIAGRPPPSAAACSPHQMCRYLVWAKQLVFLCASTGMETILLPELVLCRRSGAAYRLTARMTGMGCRGFGSGANPYQGRRYRCGCAMARSRGAKRDYNGAWNRTPKLHVRQAASGDPKKVGIHLGTVLDESFL